MKTSTAIGLIFLLGFGALGFYAFRKNVTPYVTVREAQASSDVVQVYGAINQSAMHFDARSALVTFPLTDNTHATMMVQYRGPRPGNLAQATHCVATGQWRGDHFEATTLLIKCPSKYQGDRKT